MHIRPFEPTGEEYEAFLAVKLASRPDYPTTVDMLKHHDQTRDPKLFYERLAGLVDGVPVIYGHDGEPDWAYEPGKYLLGYDLHPDHAGKGYDRLMFDHMLNLVKQRGARILLAFDREDQTDKMKLFKDYGFVETMRYPVSHLEVAAFDPEPFKPAVEKARQTGVKIYSLAELQARTPDWQHRIWDLDWEIHQDVPSPEPITRYPFDEFAKIFSRPNFTPESWFIAVDEASGDWIGLSTIWVEPANADKVYTGLTGVLRPYRRQGLATAMKLRGIDHAKKLGAKRIETNNEENNPMYRLNLQLGFKPAPPMVDFRKALEET